MSHCLRNILGLAAVSLILVAASAQPAHAQHRAPVPPALPLAQLRPNPLPLPRPTVYPPSNGTRPIGGDWWRIYPWSPYNAWQNPYWYPPYNPNYPFPPDGAYPYNPYPVPQPYPVPFPWGGVGSAGR